MERKRARALFLERACPQKGLEGSKQELKGTPTGKGWPIEESRTELAAAHGYKRTAETIGKHSVQYSVVFSIQPFIHYSPYWISATVRSPVLSPGPFASK